MTSPGGDFGSADSDLYALVDEFFYPGPTADVGCGAGETTDWLNRHGFQAIGFDADEALVEAARRAHPELDFAQAALPELPGIPSDVFSNVLCAHALTSLDGTEVDGAVTRLIEILAPGGTLLMTAPSAAGGLVSEAILHEDAVPAASGVTARRIVARKPGGR